MDQNVLFNEQTAVGRLIPQPQYSCYAELVSTGLQHIDAKIFTDMQVLDLHFYQIMHSFQDGIETPAVQQSAVIVHFADGERVKLSIFDYWFNLLFWGLPVSAGKMIDSRYL